MKNTLPCNVKVILSFFFLVISKQSLTQSTGFINSPATSVSGRLVLDPNGDGYTSATTAGFGLNDVTNSEIPYKLVRSYSIEPYGDLRRGPSHRFSDFVPDGNYVGFYTFFTGSNFLFRLRLGSVMSGSKGYSILLDTDGKFGATGSNADPNYLPATTGTNGNPGFEIEIVLETNFRLAIYNVDGTSSPVLVKAYTDWQDYSQVSIAASYDNGDPDFFRDFYIPFSDLQAAPFNLTTSSPIRMIPTTVMSPQGAIGGPKSDIYGLDDNAYPNSNDQYEAFINAQPTFTLNDLTTGGSGIGNMCTAPPVVNSPVSSGTVNISGAWTRSSLNVAVNTATITVYRNGISIGTVSGITSGSTWTLNNIALVNGDVITARAQAAGESMCFISNAVIANNCNSSNRPAQPTGFCADRKGFEATNYPAGATINIFKMTSSGQTLFYTGTLGTTYSGVTTVANGAGWMITSGCSGGSGNFAGGSYMVYYTLSGCDSKVSFACAVNTQGGWTSAPTPAPVINNATSIFTSTTSISGTAVAGSLMRLFIDDIFIASPTLTGTNWSYTFTTPLQAGQVITVRAQIADDNTGKIYYCTGVATATVNCYTKPPLINADNNNQMAAGLPITGTSSEPAGTLIRIYTTAPLLVATTPVQANGTWSTGNAATTPATYTAINATSYYATAQNGSCAVSQNSGTISAATSTTSARCGTITGPIAPNATFVSGTVSGSFTTTTINLYLDGELIGSASTNTTSWGPIAVNSTINNTLYSNGVLRIGIQESSKQEVICPSSAITITCSPIPTSPVISPTSSTIGANQSITYTISNAVAGTFYGIANSVTGESLANGIWATTNGALNITTKTFQNAGTYNIVVKATSLSGVTVCTSLSAAASLTVSSTLPVSLKSFTGKWEGDNASLEWKTSSEYNSKEFLVERSIDGVSFLGIATVTAAGNSSTERTYNKLDIKPVSNYNYYRLKMIDIDGKVAYSKVILLQKNQMGVMINTISPNPFVNELSVSLVLEKNEIIESMLTDASGKIIRISKAQGQKGLNNIKFTNIEYLPTGLYILRLQIAGILIQEKIIKTH